MTTDHSVTAGHCLCGDVRFHFPSTNAQTSACHCTQCRRWSGHYWASVEVPQDELVIENGAESIAWYPSSDDAERGFCVICGSSLFWRKIDPDARNVDVALGCLDKPTNTLITKHLYTEDAGDYYAVPPGAPHHQKGSSDA